MPSIFDAFDNRLDPENPQDALIMAQRAKYSAWQEKASQFAPDASPDREHWEIEPVSIYDSCGIARRDVASLPASSPLADRLQGHLVEAYHRRGLYFPQDDIHAIADPDETDRSDERAAYRGVLPFMAWGYDLRVPIVLTKAEDGAQFDFFFALRLLRVPLMELDGFLDYQLRLNFDGDKAGFNRYISLILEYIEVESKGWVHGQVAMSMGEDFRRAVEQKWGHKAEDGSAPDSTARLRVNDPALLDALYDDLCPYFDEGDRACLKELLHGTASRRITFRGQGKKLIGVFCLLWEHGKIGVSKTETAQWIVDSFKYLNTKTKAPAGFNYDFTYMVLTGQAKLSRGMPLPSTEKMLLRPTE